MTTTTIKIPTQRELVQERHPAPDMACRLNDHAHGLANTGKVAAAVTALRRAHAIAPDHPIILSCLGAVLFDAGRYTEGETLLRRAISIEPDYAPSFGNLGSTLGALKRYDEAKAMFLRAISIEPDYTDARWNYAMNRLDCGDWREAWPYYEARKARGGTKLYPVLPYPEWKGENLNGKTLYIQGEQGVGDRILFSRYIGWIASEYPGCKILLMLNAEDLPNFTNFMWGFRDVVEFVPNGIPWPEDVDFGIYLMSIPGVHGSTPDFIAEDPGLIMKHSMLHKNSVAIPTANGTELRVGLIWRGNPSMKRNYERSIPLELLLPLAENPDVVLYGLQFGNHRDIERLGADQLICDLTGDVGSLGFSGTAAAMLNLDLVITSCTSTAHVAGALGVPCWTLLCNNPYWIWLRDRADSVWYPNTRLFRQPSPGDWASVISEVKEELAKVAREHSSQQKAA